MFQKKELLGTLDGKRSERAGRDYFAICDCLCIIECSAFDTITVEFYHFYQHNDLFMYVQRLT